MKKLFYIFFLLIIFYLNLEAQNLENKLKGIWVKKELIQRLKENKISDSYEYPFRYIKFMDFNKSEVTVEIEHYFEQAENYVLAVTKRDANKIILKTSYKIRTNNFKKSMFEFTLNLNDKRLKIQRIDTIDDRVYEYVKLENYFNSKIKNLGIYEYILLKELLNGRYSIIDIEKNIILNGVSFNYFNAIGFYNYDFPIIISLDNKVNDKYYPILSLRRYKNKIISPRNEISSEQYLLERKGDTTNLYSFEKTNTLTIKDKKYVLIRNRSSLQSKKH